MSFVSDLLWKLLPWKLREAECAHFEQAVQRTPTTSRAARNASKQGASGYTCVAAWSAALSAAATTPLTFTPRATSRRQGTRSLDPSSRVSRGAGATSTRS